MFSIRRGLPFLACLLPAVASGQQADVTFFVIGKHASFAQAPGAAPAPVDFSFFSEIFLAGDGVAANAVLTLPTGERVAYRDMREAPGGSRDNLLLVSGENRYDSFDQLQARYPDGDYGVTFDTPSGDVDATLEFRRRPLPRPPVIEVRQGGEACRELRPGVDARVTWSEFSEGRADPNGILDDLVFVILEDEDGVRVAHSGRPFEGRPYLTYADRAFTIGGDVLTPGSGYTLSVEHALLDDTKRYDGIPAFTTRAVTTRLGIRVAERGDAACESPAPPLDSQITMFYYDDLDAPARFYGDILGLEKAFDREWVKFFRTGPSSSVGIVRRGDGAWHDPQPENAVMLSLVTSDVDAWHARLEGREGVNILKDIGEGGGIRSFLLEDPGGYTVEFFEWLDAADD